MKIEKTKVFISKGEFSTSPEFISIKDEINEAIKLVTWYGEDTFIVNPTRKGNGVKPIKEKFVNFLKSKGWKDEAQMSFAKGMNVGNVDAVKDTKYGVFAVEWETGNISSSHRALNKIGVGLIQDAIIGGILILPMRSLAKYLTDRIGNYEEIEPYFPLYENILVDDGIMGVIGISHDSESFDSPLINKGYDGNSLIRRNNLNIK